MTDRIKKLSNLTKPDLKEPQPECCGVKVLRKFMGEHMKKLLLCLTAAISFSLLNVATADPVTDCGTRMQGMQYGAAFTFCEKACNLNEGLGCTLLGALYYHGQGVTQDYQQAKIYYEKACNLNFGTGCFGLGEFYYNGQGVKQDYQQAKTYFDKACNLNSGLGCRKLGVIYKKGQGVRQNYQTAKEYYGKACDLGDQDGCDSYRELNEKGY